MQLLRTNITDGTTEILTIVLSQETFFAAALEQETPYLVEITRDGDLVAITDLDGEPIHQNLEWEVPTEIPSEVLMAVVEGWANGPYMVTIAGIVGEAHIAKEESA